MHYILLIYKCRKSDAMFKMEGAFQSKLSIIILKFINKVKKSKSVYKPCIDKN